MFEIAKFVMRRSKFRKVLKKVWYFIWEDNSIWSWIVNIILAFVLIKFIVYPGLGFVLGTNYPIVAVVSSSMEHNSVPKSCIESEQVKVLGFEINKCVKYHYDLCGKPFDKEMSFVFDEYWDVCGGWYNGNTDITKEGFMEFKFSNGFNKGDIMILRGAKPADIKVGEILVFRSTKPGIADPIIHRVVEVGENNNEWYAVTKGDNNFRSDNGNISEDRIVGKALIRVPLLGYIKIWAVELVNLILRGIGYVLS